MPMKTVIDYWFTIEPYVFVNVTNKSVLLYNTLDGVTIESDKNEVIKLFRELLHEENCGVVLLTNERYQQKDVNDFIRELRYNYMGDIIDVTFSKCKPVQLLPYFNYPDKFEIYKRHNFSSLKNVLENLSEISIHVNSTTNVTKLITFFESIPGSPIFNLIGNMWEVPKYSELLSYLDQHLSPKNMVCSYKNLIALQPAFKNDFSYRILVHFPIDKQLWENTKHVLLSQTLPVDYVFNISSEEECQQAEKIIEECQIERYRLNPIYTGDNMHFFEDNVFLTKEEILSTSMTIKDFFARKAINIYDFGKIIILPNGDAYANLNHPILGNIYRNSIYEIVHKEVDAGKSWFRIRNLAPCTDCIYQWLCPPPSDYEIAIGRMNLCHVKQ